eukprot:TCONS_00034460-protein
MEEDSLFAPSQLEHNSNAVEEPPEQVDFTPNLTLREIPLKRALKTYVIATVLKKYLTVGVRVLWKEEDYSKMYERRNFLEGLLKNMDEVKMTISCVTSIAKKEETMTGFSFWIVYDHPDITSSKFENMICKRFLEAGCRISYYKALKGRGIYFCYKF